MDKILKTCDSGEQVESSADAVAIQPVAETARQGWKTEFEKMAAHGDDQLLDGDQMGAALWDEEWEEIS